MARRASRDEPSCFEFAARLMDAIVSLLFRNPVRELCQSRTEILFGSEAELLLGFADGGEAVPDVPGAELAGHFGGKVGAVHSLRQTDRDVFHRSRPAAADIEYLAGR